MYEVTMDLAGDWVKTVKEILQSAGDQLVEEVTNEELSIRYFRLTMSAEQAETAARDTLMRFRDMEKVINNNLETTIVPDIRKRTNYDGNQFHFCWVYNQGEHIVELNSEYRIPL